MNKKKSKKLKLGNKSNGNNVLNEEIIIKNNPFKSSLVYRHKQDACASGFAYSL
tara:strand:+ start:737 stop:898 length:162 start_codon:yes stop_codon:yes gene_type:complete